MSAVLPFDGFLDLLRAKGFGVGLHEYFALANLLEHWDRTHADELGDAIAALVARNEDELQGIRRLYAELYLPPAPPAITSDPHRDRTFARRWIWISGAIAAILIIAVTAVVVSRWYPAPPQPPQDQSQVEPQPGAPSPLAPVALPRQEAPKLPAPPQVIQRGAAIGIVAAVFLVVLTIFWALKTRDRTNAWLRESWASALAALPGPFHFRLVLRDRGSRLPRADVEDAATILGRTFRPDGQARELDVRRSVRLTLRHGLMPQLVFKPRRVAETIVVFQDVGHAMTIWRDKVDAFLADLARQGIALERCYFDGDPRAASEQPYRSTIRFETIVQRRPTSPVLIVSAGGALDAIIAAGDRNDAWLQALRGVTKKSWLTPVADVRLWPDAFHALPLDVWPMTRAGLARAARELAGIDGERADLLKLKVSRAGFVAQDDIERVKRLASVVPHPTTELLDALRRRFAPDVSDAVLVHLFAEGDRASATVLRLSDDEIRRSLEAMRRETPTLEAAARRVVLGVLRDSEPMSGSAAHERWQLSMAVQQLQLADVERQDPAAALAALQALGDGPLWEEVRRATRRVPASSALATRLARVLGGDDAPARPPDAATAGAGGGRLPWSWPGWREALPATIAAALVLVVGQLLHAFPARALEHVTGAYQLEYPQAQSAAASALRIQVRPTAGGSPPASVDVMQDSRVFRTGVTVNAATPTAVPLTSTDTGHYYQVRARLPQGNLAVSNAVWVPSDRMLVVSIDAQPWANVTLRADQGSLGPQATPFTASLLPGRYQLHFDNGGLTPPMDRTIDVSASSRTFSFAMPGFDPNATAGRLTTPAGK